MKSLKSLCSLLLLAATVSAYAQEEVIIVDRKYYKPERTPKKKKLNDNDQVIKFAPFSMLAGEINFGYERQVGVKGSVDFELGPTISKIGFGGLNSHLFNSSSPSQSENSALGFVVSAAYRYYPMDETEALNGFYVGPVMKYKLMNSVYIDESDIFQDVARGKKSMLNFYFNFGYEAWLSKTFSMDFYAGFGIGMHTQTQYTLTSEWANNEYVYDWDEHYASGAVFVGNIGIKVGIGSQTK